MKNPRNRLGRVPNTRWTSIMMPAVKKIEAPNHMKIRRCMCAPM